MKLNVLLSLLFVSSLSFAFGNDGCYVMSEPRMRMSQIFCLQGTNEIGLTPSAQISFFENSGRPLRCSTVSALENDLDNRIVALEVAGAFDMTLNLNSADFRTLTRKGVVAVNGQEFQLRQLDLSTTQRLLRYLKISNLCQ